MINRISLIRKRRFSEKKDKINRKIVFSPLLVIPLALVIISSILIKSVQREFLEERLPDNLQILLEPQKIDPDEFENIKGSLKTYLQGGRLPGFNGKALLPQAASLCRTGLG